jgi:putative membrane protein
MRYLINGGLGLLALGTAAACGGREPAQDPSTARTTTITSATYEAPGSTRKPMDATSVDQTFGGGTNANIDLMPPSSREVTQGTQATQVPTQPLKSERLLTDPEIVAFTTEAHYAEIALAEIAKRKAVDKDVKDYAAMMLTQHRDADTREKSATQKAKIAAAESDASVKLATDMQASLDAIKSRTGKDFDRAYINAQVSSHQSLLDAIDNKLLPSAQSSELKALLTQLRTQVAMHLSKAQEIKHKLGS